MLQANLISEDSHLPNSQNRSESLRKYENIRFFGEVVCDVWESCIPNVVAVPPRHSAPHSGPKPNPDTVAPSAETAFVAPNGLFFAVAATGTSQARLERVGTMIFSLSYIPGALKTMKHKGIHSKNQVFFLDPGVHRFRV